ncbi:hypothetical protein B0H34DRAFT_678255 [Crassisporium funariophilum]|nr:hypothetical protein B0H34DRAFT_678255 [Crassisporium funariophilum]
MAPRGGTRGRSRRGRGGRGTDVHHANGSAEINFQVEVPPAVEQPPAIPAAPRTRNGRQPDPPNQPGPLPPVVEEPIVAKNPQENPPHPVPDSPPNPFIVDDAPANPDIDFLNRPQTPASGEESFPEPSPGSSPRSTLRTPAHRTRGTPRVGRHSIGSNHCRPAAVGSARAAPKPKSKKGARDIWTFFEDNVREEVRTCVFCQYIFLH